MVLIRAPLRIYICPRASAPEHIRKPLPCTPTRDLVSIFSAFPYNPPIFPYSRHFFKSKAFAKGRRRPPIRASSVRPPTASERAPAALDVGCGTWSPSARIVVAMDVARTALACRRLFCAPSDRDMAAEVRLGSRASGLGKRGDRSIIAFAMDDFAAGWSAPAEMNAFAFGTLNNRPRAARDRELAFFDLPFLADSFENQVFFRPQAKRCFALRRLRRMSVVPPSFVPVPPTANPGLSFDRVASVPAPTDAGRHHPLIGVSPRRLAPCVR